MTKYNQGLDGTAVSPHLLFWSRLKIPHQNYFEIGNLISRFWKNVALLKELILQQIEDVLKLHFLQASVIFSLMFSFCFLFPPW